MNRVLQRGLFLTRQLCAGKNDGSRKLRSLQCHKAFFSDNSIISPTWQFPKPPPPPSIEELHQQGLPILHRASQHAAEGRIFMSDWEHDDNGTRDIASYHNVLAKAALISKYLHTNFPKPPSTKPAEPKLVAHLNVPGWEYAATQYGVWGAGYGSVPLALSQKRPEFEHVLQDSNPQTILIGGESCCRALFSSSLDNTTHVPVNSEELIKAAEQVGMADRIVHIKDILDREQQQDEEYWLGASGIVNSLDDPALVLYTSGTTSLPKGTLISHRNIYHQVTDLVTAWEWEPSDVAAHVLPLHHVHGVINLLSCAVYVGARLEFQPFDANKMWYQWAQPPDNFSNPTTTVLPKPNVLMAVPTIYSKLLEAADQLPDSVITAAISNTLHHMRLMVSGSAALPVSILLRWRDLTGHTLLERWGMTELAMGLSNPYREYDKAAIDATSKLHPTQRRIPEYVGQPLPSAQVRLVDPETNSTIETPGTSGELQVKGPTVFQRYLNREDATKEAFTSDGYFRTGDIAQYDGGDIQAYRILGRASADIIKTGGHKVSALEIERELLEHPDIAEVTVLGIPDETWGERVAAICRMKTDRKDLTLGELRDFCGNKLSKEKIPTRLRITSDIPKNAMGKINKKSLRGLFDQP